MTLGLSRAEGRGACEPGRTLGGEGQGGGPPLARNPRRRMKM
jgi:hypothetical protein